MFIFKLLLSYMNLYTIKHISYEVININFNFKNEKINDGKV